MDKVAWRISSLWLVVIGWAALAVMILACATPVPGRAEQPGAEASVDGAPAIDVRWSEAPDTRTPIGAIPWCDDSSGHAAAYPCKWDAREREPDPPWDSQAAPIGVWVTRVMGCPVGRIKTSEDNSVAWGCYYPPGS